MEPANIYETALFVMCRQRLVHLGAARGKSQEELNIEAYRQMNMLLENQDVIDSAAELEVTKRIAEIYG
ncbi:MAG: hypothetical protein J6L62_06420 [Clostridia bacterium]|nr:hypothetical protein [Clostridia bacterium]